MQDSVFEDKDQESNTYSKRLTNRLQQKLIIRQVADDQFEFIKTLTKAKSLYNFMSICRAILSIFYCAFVLTAILSDCHQYYNSYV